MPCTSFSLSEDVLKHNTKLQIYPDGSTKITYCKKAVFWEKGIERAPEQPKGNILAEILLKEKTNTEDTPTRDRTEEYVRRHRDRVRNITLCNRFQYFITFTLDKEQIDRYSVETFKKKLHKWLNHMVERKGLKYVLIPEYHKDGALHAHALINGALDMRNSGKRDKKGRVIYNCADWKYGFTDAVHLDHNIMRVANYVMKYITKGSDKIFGKYFWSSKNIQREPKTVLLDTPYDEVQGKEFKPLKFDDELCFKYADSSLYTRSGATLNTNSVYWTNADGTMEEMTIEQVCKRIQASC